METAADPGLMPSMGIRRTGSSRAAEIKHQPLRPREPPALTPQALPSRHGTARPPRHPPPDDARRRPGAGGDPGRARGRPLVGRASTSSGSWPSSSTAIPRRSPSSSSTTARSSATSRPSRRTTPTSATPASTSSCAPTPRAAGSVRMPSGPSPIDLIDGRGHHRLTIDPAADNEPRDRGLREGRLPPGRDDAALPADGRRPLGRRAADGPAGRRTGALTPRAVPNRACQARSGR